MTKKSQTALIVIIALILLVIGILLAGWKSMGKTSKNNSVDKTLEGIENKSIVESDPHYDLNVSYPSTINPQINSQIESFVQGQITGFKARVDDFFNKAPPPGGFSAWRHSFDINYEVFRLSEQTVSFKFGIRFSGGGGQGPVNSVVAQTFDIQTGRQYVLAEFFSDPNYLNVISEMAAKNLKDSGRLGDQYNEEMLKSGASPVESNFLNFALSEDSLIFFFQPQQLSPAAAGVQYAEIEYDDIRNLLKPEMFGNN